MHLQELPWWPESQCRASLDPQILMPRSEMSPEAGVVHALFGEQVSEGYCS
jgi:hypothetical protein